ECRAQLFGDSAGDIRYVATKLILTIHGKLVVPRVWYGVGGSHHRIGVQGTVADRVVFPRPEAIAAGENLCGDFGQCAENPALDGADRHTAGEILAVEVGLWLVPIKPRGAATPATVCLP